MAAESEAHKLRKQIAYLSGLINSAKNVPQTATTSSSYHTPRPRGSNSVSSYNSWNYQPNHHRNKYSSNSSNYSINRQKQLVPFPKSSKYVAKVLTSKQKTFPLGDKSSTTLSVDSKDRKCIENKSKVSALKGNIGQNPTKNRESSAQNKESLNASDNGKKKVSQITPTSLPQSSHESSVIASSHPSSAKESAYLSTKSELTTTKNPPNSSASHNEEIGNSSSSNLTVHCDKTQSKTVSRNSIINSSQTTLADQVSSKCPKLSSKKAQISADMFSTSCDVTGQIVHDLDTQAEIKKLRESLGYDIPDDATFKKLKSHYSHTVNYNSQANNKTSYSLLKTKSFPVSSRSVCGSISPYKLDKKSKTLPSTSISRLDFTPTHKTKHSVHHTVNRKSQYHFSSSPHSQRRLSSSKRLSGISKAQHAAKTIISKYKIRNIPAVIHKPYKTVNNSAVQFSVSSYNHLAKRFSRNTQNWRNTVFNNNVYSWKKYNSSGFFSRQKLYNRFDQHHIQRKLHHIYKLDKKSKLDIAGGSRGSEKGCRLVFINGFLYKSTGKSITKTGSKTVDNRNKATVPASKKKSSVIIKKISGKQMKTVKVRGVTFQMASDGHSLQRLDTAFKKETSRGPMENKDVKVTRVDIGGVTYVQTKPGTLVRMATHRTRVVASRVINKSITTVTNKLRKKVNKQYCMYYNRFGKCKRDKNCPFLHDPEKIAVCTRFLRGTCKVKDCLFSHKVSQEKMPVCSYFLKGRCDKDNCPYLHVKVNQDAVICRAFLDGYCPLGKECKKLHSRVCSEFAKTGKCSKGKNCQLQHTKKRRRSKTKEGNTKKIMSEKQDTVPVEEEEEMTDTKAAPLPAYISLSNYSSPLQTSLHKTTSKSSPLLIKPRL